MDESDNMLAGMQSGFLLFNISSVRFYTNTFFKITIFQLYQYTPILSITFSDSFSFSSSQFFRVIVIFPKHSKLSRTFTFLAWQFGNKNEMKAVIPLRAYCFLTSNDITKGQKNFCKYLLYQYRIKIDTYSNF